MQAVRDVLTATAPIVIPCKLTMLGGRGMTAAAILVALATYGLMIVAYYLSRYRRMHVAVMAAVIVFDVLMPFYLYMNRDWYHRLIEREEIFSFLLWMHRGLVITLYTLYVLQVQAGRKILKDKDAERLAHRGQAKAKL